MSEPTGWLSYVEPLATAVAAIVAIATALDARRSAAQQRKETEHQGVIALEELLLQHHQAVLVWANESINWMAQAASLTFFDPRKRQVIRFSTAVQSAFHIFQPYWTKVAFTFQTKTRKI